jgi:integrase
MTNILHHDPDRQCKKLQDWPELDRQLWKDALVPSNLLEGGGARSRHSDLSNLTVVTGYGRWLTWLDRQGLLDSRVKPDERITPCRVRDYVTALEAVNATLTVLSRLQQLRAAAIVMGPHRDWSWINLMASQIRTRHRPARDNRRDNFRATQGTQRPMTDIPHRDPVRQCRKLEDWPDLDRRLWNAALMPGDLLEDGGARSRYSDLSNLTVVTGYGRWLTWLDRQGLLGSRAKPDERITPCRVRDYVTALEAVNATLTVLSRLQQLRAAAIVMGPQQDWSWISRIISRVQSRHRPARPKRPRLIAVTELFDLGLTLMAGTDREHVAKRKAILYRDGLMIALLAARPLRLRNLLGLVLNDTLVRVRDLWLIQIPAADTKTKEPIELYWPEPLIAPLETYLTCHRIVLGQGYGRWTRHIDGVLWLSANGLPMTRHTAYMRIAARTRDGLGRSINPHLFRDCAATSIAIDDPDHIGIASRLLSHRAASTAERYYNHARGVEAARLMQQHILALRDGTASARE